MSALRSSLDAALARHERHGRPGLPVRGFALDRAPGRPLPGIRHTSGRRVLDPDAHLHRISPSPDGTRIAVEWADTADEDAVLGIVDVASGAVALHPGIRLRYDEVLWGDDSRSLEVVSSRDDLIVALDVDCGEWTATPTEPAARTRLFPGGARGLLAQTRSGSGSGTTLRDRATGSLLGRWAALHRALPNGSGVVAWHRDGLDVVDPAGAVRWTLRDDALKITDVAVLDDRVVVLGVRDGRTVVDVIDATRTRPVAVPSGVTVTGLAVDDGILHLAVEGPLVPPRVVTGADAGADALPGTTTRVELRATDGETLTVDLTVPAAGDGPWPTLLTCYGGFGVPHLPVFEPTVPAWIEHGGAYATAQIRGGGERGDAWRAAGRGARKQQAVDDLADIARGLVELGLTRHDLLVLVGASLGGVVAASCAFQHPEVCAGVVTTAAPLDLLALAQHPLGFRWRDEFGDDGTVDAQARLRRLSPLALAEAATDAAELPAFLGIVLGADTRVRADDTRRTVEAVQRGGGSARLWTASEAGHGGNALGDLHDLGLAVLDFAAELTMGASR
ncbi:prolyl oligopeptidase family serine peptidase [Microbacterium sp. LS_15]|uniref:prolyl oligopeptidase family serine peptidase n=1 Tax=Microbacterium sp. LS_15 TaxID=3055790 RepID=UPI0035C2251C